MQITNKVAIITGSGQGLGKEFSRQLLREGGKVCLSDINADTGNQTAKEFREQFGDEKVHFIACDVTKDEDLLNLYNGAEAFFKAPVDIFVNNAGIGMNLGWEKCMQINIIAVMKGLHLAMDRMDMRKGGKGGLIVNTASLAGIGPGSPVDDAYSVSKHGVVALTRAYGRPDVLRKTGVKVQCVCPAFAETAIIAPIRAAGGEGTAMAKAMERIGVMTPEYVSEGFLKLVKSGVNGGALGIMKDAPPFFYQDLSITNVQFLVLGSKLCDKLFGLEVFEARHQWALLAVVFLLVQFVFWCFF